MENLKNYQQMVEKLNKEDLKKFLKDLKSIKFLVKDLWRKKWLEEFKRVNFNHSLNTVEYFPVMSLDEVKEISLKFFSKSFNKNISLDQIIFKENIALDGWMRIFSDDNMLDISYKKIESFLLN